MTKIVIPIVTVVILGFIGVATFFSFSEKGVLPATSDQEQTGSPPYRVVGGDSGPNVRPEESFFQSQQKPTAKTGSIKITVLDQYTNEPMRNREVQILPFVLCAPGQPCSPQPLFEGRTDARGTVSVDRNILGRVGLQVVGNDYAGSNLFSESDAVSGQLRIELRPIVKIKIVSPNGGERIQIGNTQTIRWTMSRAVPKGYSFTLGVSGVDDTRFGGSVICVNEIPQPLPLSGECEWNVNARVGGEAAGDSPWLSGRYKLTMMLGKEGIAYDESDAPFTLILNPTAPPYIVFVTPPEGPSDTSVTLTGSFLPSGNRVDFFAGQAGGDIGANTELLASPDGRTLVFKVPKWRNPSYCRTLSCPSPLVNSPQVPLTTFPLSFNLSVINANGRSNNSAFNVKP